MQVNVKVVQLQLEKVFQYTAIDDCTGYRLLRLCVSNWEFSRRIQNSATLLGVRRLSYPVHGEFPNS